MPVVAFSTVVVEVGKMNYVNQNKKQSLTRSIVTKFPLLHDFNSRERNSSAGKGHVMRVSIV